MELLKEELQQLPRLYAQEGKGDETIIYLKLFTPDANWTWYITEYDPEERVFFGLVDGLEKEWGYVSLDELQAVRGPLGLEVERDINFTPTSLKELKKQGLV